MEEIYSEELLIQNKGVSWGEWKFSMSDKEIDRKIATLPRLNFDNKDCEHWPKLFSFLQEQRRISDLETINESLDVRASTEIAMECSSDLATQDKNMECSSLEHSAEESSSIEELTSCLIDLCNQVAPKLKHGLNNVQGDMQSFVDDVSKVRDDILSSIMVNVWSQLNSDASKFCFCIPFITSSRMCRILCEIIIKPWLEKNPPSKIEQLSTILAAEGETVCLYLVAPLLKNKDSILVKDIVTLEDLMVSMVEKDWTALLTELLSDLRELHNWQIPALAMVVENAKPSPEEVHLLTQLISSSGTCFAQSRDFGALLVAVAKSLRESDTGLVTQLKLIVNNYKGPLKFKVLNILDEVGE